MLGDFAHKPSVTITHHKQDGLTLIELMVVIAVIGILATLLLTAVSQSKRRAQQIQCVNNLRQIGVGLQNFLANNHGYISWFAKAGADYPGTWIGQMENYGLEISKPGTNYFQTGTWRCPSAQFGSWSTRPEHPSFADYGYNGFGVGNSRTNALGLYGHYSRSSGTIVPIGESEVIVPSDMMAFGDSFDGDIGLMRVNAGDLIRYGNTLTRHQGKANVLFCDGHVESPKLQFLFDDTSDSALVRWNRDHQPHRELLNP